MRFVVIFDFFIGEECISSERDFTIMEDRAFLGCDGDNNAAFFFSICDLKIDLGVGISFILEKIDDN